jgi:hypothetical protein
MRILASVAVTKPRTNEEIKEVTIWNDPLKSLLGIF